MTTSVEESGAAGRRGVWIVVVIVLAMAAYVGAGAYAANLWMTPRRNLEMVSTPASFHLAFENVRIPSRDTGIELSGWWIPRAASTKAIVMVHGRGENRTTEFYNHFLDLGAALNTYAGRGFNILMIDLRAHGASGGDHSAWGVGERHDVEGAVDWIKNKGFQPASIGALGASLGATSCVQATVEDPDISALVGDGPAIDDYPALQRSWKRYTGLPQFFFPAGELMEHVLFGYDIRKLRTVDVMKQLPPRPVLLIYGGEEITTDRAAMVRNALPENELWIVAGAPHTGAYSAVPQDYLSKVGAFFEKNLK